MNIKKINIYYDYECNLWYIVHCPFCGSARHTCKNGFQLNGMVKWKCAQCNRVFQDSKITEPEYEPRSYLMPSRAKSFSLSGDCRFHR